MNSPTSRYGDSSRARPAQSLVCEELGQFGYAVLKDVLDADELLRCSSSIDDQLTTHTSLAPDDLAAIGEVDIVRAPLVADEFFLRSIAMAPRVLELVGQLVGSYHILHLQNAVVNRPGRPHHQSAWHRDLPYLDRTSSRPLAVSALFCIDEFNASTGGTSCIPGSHLHADLPSTAFLDRHETSIEANPGDVILFDSMLVHRAGVNTSTTIRRAVNNVYSVGLIRQQIDLPRALGGRYADDPALAILLGYSSNAPDSAENYRLQRLRRLGAR